MEISLIRDFLVGDINYWKSKYKECINEMKKKFKKSHHTGIRENNKKYEIYIYKEIIKLSKTIGCVKACVKLNVSYNQYIKLKNKYS